MSTSPRTARLSCASRKPKSTHTLPSSSTAAWKRPYEGEDRKVIPSPKVATYDLKPEMSAYEVADECAARIRSGKYDVIILNFANCDMVGHTGAFDAAVKAVEAVDACVEKVWEAVQDMGGCMFLTADHGNADKMDEPTTVRRSPRIPPIRFRSSWRAAVM